MQEPFKAETARTVCSQDVVQDCWTGAEVLEREPPQKVLDAVSKDHRCCQVSFMLLFSVRSCGAMSDLQLTFSNSHCFFYVLSYVRSLIKIKKVI